MPAVGVQFGGNPAQLLQAYNQIYAANVKMQQQYQQLANQQQQHAQQSARHHSATQHFVQAQISTLKHEALAYITVSHALGHVKAAYGELERKIADVARQTNLSNQELLKNVALSGQIANAKQIVSGLGSISGISRGEAQQAYAGVVAHAPLTSDPKRLLELTSGAAQVARLGVGLDLEGSGGLVGDLSTLAPGRSGSALGDLAFALQSRLGRNRDKFQSTRGTQLPALRKLMDAGIFGSAEEGLGMAAVAAENNPAMMGQIASALLDKQYDRPQLTRGMSRDEYTAKIGLSRAKSPQELWALIRSNPEAARAAGVEGLGGFNWAAAKDAAQYLSGSAGAVERARAQFGQLPEGREAQMEREAINAKTAAEKAAYSSVGSRRERANLFFEQRIAEDIKAQGIDPNGLMGGMQSLDRWMTIGWTRFITRINPETRNVDPDQAAMIAYDYNYGGKSGSIAASREQELRILEDIHEETKRANDARSQGPAPVAPEKER